jgi:organic radical activating enzyme
MFGEKDMKWTNRGHEFDELGAYLCNLQKIYIWGAGEAGKHFYNQLLWLGIVDDYDIEFVDSNTCKQNTYYCDKIIISPEKLLNDFTDGGESVIVITTSAKSIINSISSVNNIRLKYNCFTSCWTNNGKAPQTGKLLLPILMMYKYGKLYTDMVAHICTHRCNLRCKHCLNFITYFKNSSDDTLETIKNEANIYFSKVDFVSLYHINGGEVFLMPHIHEIVDYIGSNYRKRIFELLLTTNGTIPPTDKLLDSIKRNDATLWIDDYRETIPAIRVKYNKTIAKVKEAGIRYSEIKVDHWLDLKPKNDNFFITDENACITRYIQCANPFRRLRGGNLVACVWHSCAVAAGIENYSSGDFLDISSVMKKEIMEFQFGFTEKGYVEMCKNCAGFLPINKNFIPVAQQEEK